VANLNQVIKPGSTLHPCRPQRTTVYTRVGPDVYVVFDDHTAKLWKTDRHRMSWNMPKAIPADYRTGGNTATRSDDAAFKNCRVGKDDTINPDINGSPNKYTRHHMCACLDDRLVLDDHVGVDASERMHFREVRDSGPGVNTGGPPLVRRKQRRGASEGAPGVLDPQSYNLCGRVALADKHGARSSFVQITLVAGAVTETEIREPGLSKARDAHY
jgi:hypothetical protein